MPINFDIDQELISKHLKSTRFLPKVAATALILLAAVGVWFIFEFALSDNTLVDHNFAALVEKPFSFRGNQEVFDLLKQQERYTGTQLSDFTIYIEDTSVVGARGLNLTTLDGQAFSAAPGSATDLSSQFADPASTPAESTPDSATLPPAEEVAPQDSVTLTF